MKFTEKEMEIQRQANQVHKLEQQSEEAKNNQGTVMLWLSFLANLELTLSPEAQNEFRDIERMNLVKTMMHCGMEDYPCTVGDPKGLRSSGSMICKSCGKEYGNHPDDWRVIGYGNVPYLVVLCDGQRVKL